MRTVFSTFLIPFFLPCTILAADSKTSASVKPCTISSPSSGSFFDLNAIAVQPSGKDSQKAHKDDRTRSWPAKGYDYGVNFTINFCAPVVEKLENVVGVDEDLWRNISAYYKVSEKTYSIGQVATEPVFRGRKLVLNYTNGSPCDTPSSTLPRKLLDDDEEGDNDKDSHKHRTGDRKKIKASAVRRKSTIISFLCDRDPLAAKAAVSFVGASPDECTYFFETRSIAACGGVSEAQQMLGPAGVFGVILLIAAAVYFFGGIAYQRTVMHQRGWKQLPNYSLWAGMGNFVKDIFTILFSSCTRLVSRRKGYNQLSSNARGNRGEDENRLIDQLDEEWDD